MAKVQRKTGMTIDIRVNNRDGNKLGSFEITSGNLYYYKKKRKSRHKEIHMGKPNQIDR